MFTHIHTTVHDLSKIHPLPTPDEYHKQLLSQLVEKYKFVVEINKSKIPSGGNGLFLRGSVVHPGTVVAIFPGKVHLAEFLTNEYVESELFPDPHFYLMGR